MLTYIPVSFLFLGFGLGLKIWLGLGFGIGNLIGGAAGTVDPFGRKTPITWEIWAVINCDPINPSELLGSVRACAHTWSKKLCS